MRRRRTKPKPAQKPAVRIPAEYCGIAKLLRNRMPTGGAVILERYAITKMMSVDLKNDARGR
jgi:hypothetical protein